METAGIEFERPLRLAVVCKSAYLRSWKIFVLCFRNFSNSCHMQNSQNLLMARNILHRSYVVYVLMDVNDDNVNGLSCGFTAHYCLKIYVIYLLLHKIFIFKTLSFMFSFKRSVWFKLNKYYIIYCLYLF